MPTPIEKIGVNYLMVSYYDYYQDKVSHKGITQRERNMRHMSKEFERYFENALNRHTCLLNDVETELVFQDHSQSNNKDLSDDKYVIAPNSTPIKTGDYIIWQDAYWMIFTREFKTITTHQQAKIKEVNESIRWILSDGAISNNGNGWPAYAISQTLYTMGVSENTYLPVVDSKIMIHIQDNPETRSIKMNDRFFVGGRVYLTKYINTVSRPGIITYLLDETTVGPEDNEELGIANYYGESNNQDDTEIDLSDMRISGEIDPKYGRVYHYKAEGFKAKEWILDHSTNDTPAYLEGQDEDGINIRFKNDGRYIGESIVLIAKTEDGSYVSLTLFIAKKF